MRIYRTNLSLSYNILYEMANKTHDETGGCIFQWKIENMSNCWWMWDSQEIVSPSFVADAVQNTKWSLSMFVGTKDFRFNLQREKDSCGPDSIEVNYRFSILGRDGSILINENRGKSKFGKGEYNTDMKCFLQRERIFGTERETLIPEDVLTVQCGIWIKYEPNMQFNHAFASSAIKVKRRVFMCRIGEKSIQKFGMKNTFKDPLFEFDVVLNESLDEMDAKISSIGNSIKYISCNSWIFDSEGSRENCGTNKYSGNDIHEQLLPIKMSLPVKVKRNKSKYFKNDILSLGFEFVLAKLEHYLDYSKIFAGLENLVKEIPENLGFLIDDLKSLYNEGCFSDMELRTSSKTFPVHKIILSSRSEGFKRMLMDDVEAIQRGYVQIDDFDEETVQRMLQYLYGASLEDLQFESACKLYKIADKYEILSLKVICSSFLVENLCPANACEVLSLAIHHNDDNLNSVVQDYVLGKYNQIFCLQEWKDFMENHLELAADIMLRKHIERK